MPSTASTQYSRESRTLSTTSGYSCSMAMMASLQLKPQGGSEKLRSRGIRSYSFTSQIHTQREVAQSRTTESIPAHIGSSTGWQRSVDEQPRQDVSWGVGAQQDYKEALKWFMKAAPELCSGTACAEDHVLRGTWCNER